MGERNIHRGRLLLLLVLAAAVVCAAGVLFLGWRRRRAAEGAAEAPRRSHPARTGARPARPPRQKGKGRWARRVATGVLAAVAVVCAAGLIGYGWEARQAATQFRDLSAQVHAPAVLPAQGGRETDPVPEEDPRPAALEALQAENGDLAGWVSIPGTALDYPVMYTPQQPQYYLHRDFSGAYSYSGTPFLEERCTLDSDNLILWGHNMKAGTMFAGLLRYRDAAYAQAHAWVSFTTPEETRWYQVVAAFASEVDAEGDYFRWYNALEFPDPASFDAFAEGLRASSVLPVPGDLAPGDQFLTLATCSYHDQNGRFVVVARYSPEGLPG